MDKQLSVRTYTTSWRGRGRTPATHSRKLRLTSRVIKCTPRDHATMMAVKLDALKKVDYGSPDDVDYGSPDH